MQSQKDDGFTTDTLLTLEEKNLLADATNPNIKVPYSPNIISNDYSEFDPKRLSYGNRKNNENSYFPKRIIYVMKDRVYRDPRLAQICAMILLLWLLVALLISGILMYRYFIYKPTYCGWYSTDFISNGIPSHLEQNMEIDSDGLYEKIQVPQFGLNRKTIYIHDFRKNVTAIVDMLEQRCFLKELDHNVIPMPKMFIDLINQLQEAFPDGERHYPKVVKETYRVGARISVENLLKLDSIMITRHCLSKDVFHLQRVSRSLEHPYFYRRKKRGVNPSQILHFSEYQGNNVIQDDIIF
uniref:Integral membrane protein 2 n=1 Tax=Parastrongyloides trichosuri TaxID=131310 RepID=A0A0N4ZT46_PARTI